MEHLLVALWKAPQIEAATCHDVLVREWVPAAVATPGTRALTVYVADVPQGRFSNGPDAVVVLGLDHAHDLDALPERDHLHRVAGRIEVWRVTPNHPRRRVRTWPLGTPSPGVTMISLVQRADGISHAQFVRHWNEHHAPLALRHHVGLAEYHQYSARRAFTPSGAWIDGIAVLSFDSRDDFEQRFYDSDEGRARIAADVAEFIRRERSQASLMTELVVLDPA